jgi:dedicator of cytokinesis protein 3
LKLEAELYQWDLETQLEESIEPEHPVQTHFARKESLYKRIIELFDKGKAWEKATELCKELAQQYETKTLDYLSLKNILLQQASFLDLILSVDRPAPSYFRVHCWGQAWPLAQRNKDWIVQGADWEKLSSFSERMQLLYPTAQLVNANTMPSFEAMEKGQYLQVVALVPIPDRNNPVFTIPGVSPRIRQYHEHHFVKQFSYQMISRKGSANRQDNAESNSDSVADVWTERRILYSEASFPNIARKANVANYATIRSSPIENAIQAIKSKNDELLELERKFEPLSYDEKEDVNVNSLSLALTSIIDSPLNGGVHRYKEAFLSETNVKQQRENKEATEFIRRLKDAIEDQVIIVRRCLEIHQNLVSKEMKPFHKSLVECISLMELTDELVFNKNFAEELAVVRPATPRRRPSAVPKKRNASVKEVVDERTPVVASHPPIIPPINIETAPAPIPASVEHPGNMSRTSSSVSLSPGASVKGLRKTLSFRGRKSGES